MPWETGDRIALSKLYALIQELLAEQKRTNENLERIAQILTQRHAERSRGI